jgi:hypothetical protein
MTAALTAMTRAFCAAALAAAGLAATLQAQAPDLSGTWKISRETSKVSAGAGLIGLGGNTGTPGTLYITQAANGVLTVGSDINESQARLYRPGGNTVIAAAQGTTLSLATRWDGRALVAEGGPTSAAGAPPSLKERFVLSADGKSLTVTVTAVAATGELTSSLVYAKAQTEPPCQQWPTPCK